MKKLITLILGITLVYSCSTSSDGNGNTTAVPVPPSNLTGTVASTTQINLSWTDNSTNETGFKIERKTGNGSFALVGTTTINVSTFNDTGLTPSTTYTYRVYSYNSGGNSPTYSNELTLTSQNYIPINVPGPNVTDIDGNVYQSVTNCSQTWTKTNLNVSKYSDGTIIPQVTSATQWANLTTGAWCYYNNDPANGAIYGKLYNWYAVMGIYDTNSLSNPALRKNLAPTGWHIPTDAEWTTFTTCIGGESVAGGILKETGTTHWLSPNTGASNSCGFTGLPGGFFFSTTAFGNLGMQAYWWCGTEHNAIGGYTHQLSYDRVILSTRGTGLKALGLSVRCVKD